MGAGGTPRHDNHNENMTDESDLPPFGDVQYDELRKIIDSRLLFIRAVGKRLDRAASDLRYGDEYGAAEELSAAANEIRRATQHFDE